MRALRMGAVLIEALVAGILLALVAGTATTLMRSQSQIAQDVTLRSERNDAIRSALLTLQADLQNVVPAVDVYAVARDSIAARIFRGVAITCGQRDHLTLVRYHGLRLPDARKDSALQVGVENVVAFKAVAAAPASCVTATSEPILAFDFGMAVSPNSMWLIFESGAYHLQGNALRYRRGTETRQPITNELIDVRRSGFRVAADSIIKAIQVELQDKRTAAIVRNTVRLRNAK